MRWFLRHWYEVSALVGLAALSVLAIYGGRLSVTERLLIANFAVMNLHFFEEFAYPGGFPVVANIYMLKGIRPEEGLNQVSAVFGNWWFAYVVYLLPVFVHPCLALVLSPPVFGLVEVVMHGAVLPLMLKRFNNPGLWTSLFGFLPLGVAHVAYGHQHDHAAGWDFALAFLYSMATYVLVFRIFANKVLGRLGAHYRFAPEEIARGIGRDWLAQQREGRRG